MNYDISAVSVLVVESHQHLRKLMCDILRQFGVGKIDAAPNMDEAFKIFCENGADLIVTDWSPTLDALELVDRVRRDPRSRDFYVPMVTVTAFCDMPHVCAARDAGIHEFLAKPFTAQHLYARIRSLIENPRLFIRLGDYFGPDRRRRRMAWNSTERRGGHANRSRADRRKKRAPIPHPERRDRKTVDSRKEGRDSHNMQAA